MTPDAPPHATGRAPAPPLPDGSKNMNPPGLTFWALVQEDYRCHGSDFFSQGFWALFTIPLLFLLIVSHFFIISYIVFSCFVIFINLEEL